MERHVFQIAVTDEQKHYAIGLVDYSIANHPVTDIFANDPDGKKRQREFRYTGTLGEVVFADAYHLPRPTRYFGAIDGQDNGQDFLLDHHGERYSIDVKSMHRKGNRFRENYVLNIPAYQLYKEFSVTDYYFCISFHKADNVTYATFLGFIKKEDVLSGKIGDLFKEGTTRIREDNTEFIFHRDTYEIMFKHIDPPIVLDQIRNMAGFKRIDISPVIAKIISISHPHDEKRVMRAAFDAGFPTIVLMENGFTQLSKPHGEQFNACSAGRLLMLSPSKRNGAPTNIGAPFI